MLHEDKNCNTEASKNVQHFRQKIAEAVSVLCVTHLKGFYVLHERTVTVASVFFYSQLQRGISKRAAFSVMKARLS